METYTFRLKPNQDLLMSLEGFLKAHGIQAGCVLACVGSLRKAAIRFADQAVITKSWESSSPCRRDDHPVRACLECRAGSGRSSSRWDQLDLSYAISWALDQSLGMPFVLEAVDRALSGPPQF